MTDDLRTDLTKLADGLACQFGTARYVGAEIRALLAAHPAREESPFAPGAVASRLTESPTQGLVPAPVSGTRREDVDEDGLTLLEQAIAKRLYERWADASGELTIRTDPRDVALHLRAVLPAPPEVDAHEAWEQGYDRAEADHDGTGLWARGKRANPYIARGATHV